MGLRVWSLGFGMVFWDGSRACGLRGSGFRVWSLGFGAQGLEFEGLGVIWV